VDENWIGENPDPNSVRDFQHNGIGSPFLNSSLDISIPAEMANKIINERLGANSQTDVRSFKIGSLFSAAEDKFLTKVQPTETTTEQDAQNTDLNAAEEANDTAAKVGEQDKLIDARNTSQITDPNSGETAFLYKDANGNVIKTVKVFKDDDGKEVMDIKYTNLPDVSSEDAKAATDATAAAKVDRVTSNLEKIDVVPKPTIYKLPSITSDAKLGVEAYFFVYCLDDTDFFESMKNYYFQKKGSGSLSQPLPIKYSFTILGNSGIRRGDTFKINGIPRRYAEKGIFQVTGIEHSLSGMRWETTVEALYRQVE
jgi:hypothetical protein